MIRTCIRLAALVACAAATVCAAAVTTDKVDCPPGVPNRYLAFTPSNPDSRQLTGVTAGVLGLDPDSMTVTIQDGTIDVLLTGPIAAVPAPPQKCMGLSLGALPPAIYTVNFSAVDPAQPLLGTILLASYVLDVGAGDTGVTGLWWNPDQPGWGIHLTQRGPIVFAAWFTYDRQGRPLWTVAPDCELVAHPPVNDCTDILYQVSGPPYFGVPFDGTKVQPSALGKATFTFSSRDEGTVSAFTPNGLFTSRITRQRIATGPVPAIDYSDLWWNPNESGWGIAITHQAAVMFLAWFVYDEAGEPIWYVASDCAVSATRDGCTGKLYRTTGPAFDFAPTFDPSRVQVFEAGTASLLFTDADHGTLSYTVGGATATRPITRQLF